jgi:hypothetical protein
VIASIVLKHSQTLLLSEKHGIEAVSSSASMVGACQVSPVQSAGGNGSHTNKAMVVHCLETVEIHLSHRSVDLLSGPYPVLIENGMEA